MLAVKLRRDRVVAVLEKKIYVYNFASLGLIDSIETMSNPKGLCAICSARAMVLACPGLKPGCVKVDTGRRDLIIQAHESDLACITLNMEGTLLATASDNGTLIRVFSTADGSALQELRRGSDKAIIYCIAIDPASQYMACTSDKGTVHIWGLSKETTAVAALDSGAASTAESSRSQSRSQSRPRSRSTSNAAPGVEDSANSGADRGSGSSGSGGGAGGTSGSGDSGGEVGSGVQNTTSNFSFLRGLVPLNYLNSEWSFAQFRPRSSNHETRALVAFGSKPKTIVVVVADGGHYTASFANGGTCVETGYVRFARSSTDDDDDDQ